MRNGNMMAGFESLPIEYGALPRDVVPNLQSPESRLVKQVVIGTGCSAAEVSRCVAAPAIEDLPGSCHVTAN